MADFSDQETDCELVFDDELLDDYAPTRVSVGRRKELPPLARSPEHNVQPQQVRAGDLLAGKYRVERVHRGSVLGVTLEALHVQLGQRVAVRLLAADHQAYPEAMSRFLRGARLAVQFQNEHTARLIDVGTLENGVPYIVAEFLGGSDLQRVLRVRDVLSVPEAVDYLLQACEGLADAHAHNIVHRNLKPSNFFLTRVDGTKKLAVLDFGVSDDPLTDATINLGGTQGVMHAFAYLAPEQIREPAAVDARADIWALGAILHEILTGSPLYEASTTPALLAMIAADPPVPVSHLRPEIPAELEAVVLRCVAKDRDQRFANIAELANALRPFASVEGLRSVDRVSKVTGRRTRSTQPPQLPGQQRSSRAIVRVSQPAAKVESKPPAHSGRRWGELALTGLGLAVAGALGVFVGVSAMERALASAMAQRAVVADLSPALPASVAQTSVVPVAQVPAVAQAPATESSPTAQALQATRALPAQALPVPTQPIPFRAAAPRDPLAAAPVAVASRPAVAVIPVGQLAPSRPVSRTGSVSKGALPDETALADKLRASKPVAGHGLFDDAN